MAAGDQGWYSLEGVLYMKTSGGLNYLIPKKKLYFALNECENSLVFYKDKADFCRKKDKQGSIKLANSACTLLENNRKGFVIHADGKKYEFEGENESSADCWLHALRHRKETDINDNLRFENSSDEENGILSTAHLTNGQPYHRTISKLGSDSGTSTEPTPLPTIRTGGDCEAPGESGVGATSEVSVDLCRCACKQRRFQEPVPGWLDHWVSGWVNEQPYMAAIDEEHPLCENGEEDEELTNSGEEQLRKQSASTSTFDSRKRSSVCSNDIFMCDELHRLRVVDGRQKQKIQQLAADKTELEIEVERLRQRCKDDFEQRENAVLSVMNDTSKTTLVIQNRFLNSEVIRLNERCQTAERKLVEYNKKIASRDMEMQEFKREYVYLLQSCIRIPISEHTTGDVVQVKLFGGNLHERRVRKLLEVARQQDPTLPTFENVCNPASFHVDEYGFRHTFEDVSLALHYICTQLHNHYQSQLESHKNHKRRWKIVLDECDQKINNTVIHETRSLCRAGIPRSLRSTIWRILIHQQVVDLKTKFGKYYFRNLCSSQGTPADRHYCANHQKQVTLDLLRTMPNNVHFMSATCKGVTQLQSVLRAYCLHNGSIGYCQGMNFIAATCLLFVGPEDTFWFLIAVTERYFDRSYFDQSLTGAQADQLRKC
ncbi:hypothetical protein L596_015341 [Steinernema carpocapsae]|uniref:Rab-GAP TBC domain-containing protein n=1 Tax=Steinernema carpocapsae TaxID=34508 RepID=A0A4U5NEP1_STECR|nr:hypothetical protein L596_015341 [Steinernema carpocapsae]